MTGMIPEERLVEQNELRKRLGLPILNLDGKLECVNCRQWKPDEEFYRQSSAPHRRGRRYSCKECCKGIKNQWRERNRIPCENCGALRSPANESEPSVERLLCWNCYMKHRPKRKAIRGKGTKRVSPERAMLRAKGYKV